MDIWADMVVSAAHQEYNSRRVLSKVTDQIKDGKDIFGRNAQFIRCEIDESFPEYIRTHQKELDFLIMQKEKRAVRLLRRIKVGVRDGVYGMLLSVKRCVRKVMKK